MQLNFLRSSTLSKSRLHLLLLISLLFSANVSAQQAEIQPVSRMLDIQAGESVFARPRRVENSVIGAKTESAGPFSFHEASAVERAAFDLTNEARLTNGLLPLAWDAELCRLARNHSEDMSRRRYFDHETPEGLRPKDRVRAGGVYGFRVIAENIAYNKGYENPAALAVDRWMNSSGHRANILYNRFQYSAIGSYVASDGTVYLTQIFISR